MMKTKLTKRVLVKSANFSLFMATLFLFAIYSFNVKSQSTVFFDDFSSNDITSGGTPTMIWTPVSTVEPMNIEIRNGVLSIANNNPKGNTGEPGRSYITGDLSNYDSLFNNKLSANASNITWTFNASFSSFKPRGFYLNEKNYAFAIVLVANNADLLSNETEGYALVFKRFGNAATAPQLVKFSKGLGRDSNIIPFVGPSSNYDVGKNFCSYKVIYSPSSNTWQLYYRIDSPSTGEGSKKFNDPSNESLGVMKQIGEAVVDNTFTSDEMKVFGFYLNHGINASQNYGKAMVDNFKVVVE